MEFVAASRTFTITQVGVDSIVLFGPADFLVESGARQEQAA
jgi:hypothetical protein